MEVLGGRCWDAARSKVWVWVWVRECVWLCYIWYVYVNADELVFACLAAAGVRRWKGLGGSAGPL